MTSEAIPVEPEAPAALPASPSLLQTVLSDRRMMAVAAALLANLASNVVDVVPFLGPLVDLVADLGFETIALLIACSIVRRDRKPLKALLLLGGLSIAKTALVALNILPEIGSVVETLSEAGIDLTQLWFLKEILTRSATQPAPKR